MNLSRKITRAKILGILCIIFGIGCNKFVIEAMVSADGNISALPVNIGIICLQAAFISAGILYLRRHYDVLAKIGVGLLLLFVLQFWVRVFIEVPFPKKRMFKALPFPPSLFESGMQYRDQISRYEARFRSLKEVLPLHGVVGYIGSPHLSAENAKFHYGLTTYALSPVRVDQSTMHELIVGNFPDSENISPIDEIDGLTLIKDFGNGVALFKRKGK